MDKEYTMSTHFNTMNLLHSIREIPSDLITSTEKYILVILLSATNEDNLTWHSQDTIAFFAGMSERRVRDPIKSLAQKKFIFIEKPTTYGRKKTNKYSMNVEYILSFYVGKKTDKTSSFYTRKGDEMSSFNEERGTKRPKKGDKTSGERGTKRPIKIEREERKKEGSHAAPEEAAYDPLLNPSPEDLAIKEKALRDIAEMRRRGFKPPGFSMDFISMNKH